MSKRTIKATHSCIDRWFKIRDEGVSKHEGSCALCDKFCNYRGIHNDLDCVDGKGNKCPIYERTGKDGCQRTSYAKVFDRHTHDSWGLREEIDLDRNKKDRLRYRQCTKLIDLLISLLPNKERKYYYD